VHHVSNWSDIEGAWLLLSSPAACSADQAEHGATYGGAAPAAAVAPWAELGPLDGGNSHGTSSGTAGGMRAGVTTLFSTLKIMIEKGSLFQNQ
jgi:hypothetical protein